MKTKTNKKKSLWREIFERGRGRKREERCLFPIARIPLWLLQPCQHPHHSSRGLPLSSFCEMPLPMSHFILVLCCRDFGSAALLVFLRHLFPLPIWPASYLCRRPVFQWSVPTLDPRPWNLDPWRYLNVYDLFHRGLYTFSILSNSVS